jgi:hypothetical protein
MRSLRSIVYSKPCFQTGLVRIPTASSSISVGVRWLRGDCVQRGRFYRDLSEVAVVLQTARPITDFSPTYSQAVPLYPLYPREIIRNTFYLSSGSPSYSAVAAKTHCS